MQRECIDGSQAVVWGPSAPPAGAALAAEEDRRGSVLPVPRLLPPALTAPFKQRSSRLCRLSDEGVPAPPLGM